MVDDRGFVTVKGDVVHRPVGPWSATVHDLLRHLAAKGLPVPEPLELHADHEVLSLVPGDAGDLAWPHQASVAAVNSAGAMMRAMHDATLDWRAPSDAVWGAPPEGGPVICHGDPKPPNMTWRDGRVVGLFDWDVARPAQRLSDVAYALYWFAPFDADEAELTRRALPLDVDAHARMDAFLEGYGWNEEVDLIAAVTARRKLAVHEVVLAAEEGIEPQATWLAQGVPESWLAPPELAGSTHEPRPAEGQQP